MVWYTPGVETKAPAFLQEAVWVISSLELLA